MLQGILLAYFWPTNFLFWIKYFADLNYWMTEMPFTTIFLLLLQGINFLLFFFFFYFGAFQKVVKHCKHQSCIADLQITLLHQRQVTQSHNVWCIISKIL